MADEVVLVSFGEAPEAGADKIARISVPEGTVLDDAADTVISVFDAEAPAVVLVEPARPMKTLAGIASGYSENLLLRAADVQMKEQRRLVLMVRETPFSAIHVDNMARLARVPGVMLMPPMLTFYNGPATLDEAVHHIAAKALEAVGVSCANYKRWS